MSTPNSDGETHAPDVVGVQEAAEILGCSRQYVYILYGSPGFPPAKRLVGGPVWATDAMRRYAAERKR